MKTTMKKTFGLLFLIFWLGQSMVCQTSPTSLPTQYLQFYQKAKQFSAQGNANGAIEACLSAINYLEFANPEHRILMADLYFDIAQLEVEVVRQLKAIQKGLVALCRNYESRNFYEHPPLEQVVYPKKVLGFINLKIYLLFHYWKSTRGDAKFLNYALKSCHFADHLISLSLIHI